MRAKDLLRLLARTAVTSSRAYVRYAPAHPGKRWFWRRVFMRHLAWRGHRTVARTVFGASVAVDTADLIQRHIYHYGVWEPNLTRWLGERLRTGDTFVDVGANVGYFTLLAARLVGARGRVISLEPSPQIFASLCANVERNGCRNVRLLQIAAADQAGELLLEEGPPSNSGMTTTLRADEDVPGTRVPARPLSACLSAEELSEARVIKIDVEGGEWEAMSGLLPAIDLLPRDCALVVEVSPTRLLQRGHTAEAFLDRLTARGFRGSLLVNDYDPASYFDARFTPPTPLVEPPASSADIIFTRD